MVYAPGDSPEKYRGQRLGNKRYPSNWWVPLVIFILITIIQIIWLCRTDIIRESTKRGIFENLVFWGAFWTIAILYLCIEGDAKIVWITIAVITIFPLIVYVIIYFTGDLDGLYNQ